jgi:hypothetical protein
MTIPQAAEMSVDHRIQTPIAANIAELHDNLNTRELPVVAVGRGGNHDWLHKLNRLIRKGIS